MLRLRAEALAEHLEAPTGLGRRVLGARASPPACGDCGLKPSLSAGKPRRGLGVESWVRGRPRPHARRRRAHLEQTLLICAPEARAPMNLNGVRASCPPAETAG
jgi:hypothetical protein